MLHHTNYTTIVTRLDYTKLQLQVQLPLHYTTLHYTTLHYTKLQLQLQLQLDYTTLIETGR